MKTNLSHEEISGLCLELSLLLHAGVGLGNGLALLSEESDGRGREWLESMARQVDEGAPLSAAMRETGRFPAYVCGLIEVGETAGRTEEALSALSRYYEDRVRMDRRVKSALLYPAVMLAVMLIVIAVLLVRVLPIFDDVYASLGGRLTGVAGGLLELGRWMDRAMPVLWALLAPLMIAAALLVFATAVNSLDSGRDEENLRQLEAALRRACVACYATEGVYPPNVEYLKDRYGIQVDEERYKVDYQIFAKNLMPGITVLELKS